MNDFGSLVASTEHGAVLETFLDEKLGREKHLATTVPSYNILFQRTMILRLHRLIRLPKPKLKLL